MTTIERKEEKRERVKVQVWSKKNKMTKKTNNLNIAHMGTQMYYEKKKKISPKKNQEV